MCEFHTFYPSPDIKMIKSWLMRWVGNKTRMEEKYIHNFSRNTSREEAKRNT
jgi:hypothetical protein